MEDKVIHEGIVQRVSEGKITVVIINASACSTCHAEGACLASDMKEKEIEITTYTGDYHIGQKVNIIGRSAEVLKATFYGYFLPFVLVITTLLMINYFTRNEGLAGITALTILIPYYASLHFLKKYFKRSFAFEISAINN